MQLTLFRDNASMSLISFFFFFNDTATTEIYTFPYTTLFRSRAADQDRLFGRLMGRLDGAAVCRAVRRSDRSEEHTSELQSLAYLVCRLLLEKKNTRRLVHLSEYQCSL